MDREARAARDPKKREAGQVQSLRRALMLLDRLAESAEGMTLTELAQRAVLPTSTAHRLLTTLESARYVRFESGENLWQVGVQAFATGAAFARSRDIVRQSRRYMRRLMETTGETVNLYVEEEGEAVCLSQIECRQMMRAISKPGGGVKMHCSSSGKAILAHVSDERLQWILQRHGLPRITDMTITTVDRLMVDLEAIRGRGYAIDDDEHAVGLRCVASPVFDEHGMPLAAFSISGPRARITDDKLAMLGAQVRATAADVTREIGGQPPDDAA